MTITMMTTVVFQCIFLFLVAEKVLLFVVVSFFFFFWRKELLEHVFLFFFVVAAHDDDFEVAATMEMSTSFYWSSFYDKTSFYSSRPKHRYWWIATVYDVLLVYYSTVLLHCGFPSIFNEGWVVAVTATSVIIQMLCPISAQSSRAILQSTIMVRKTQIKLLVITDDMVLSHLKIKNKK